MVSRVGKWGGSLSVRLPKNIVELLAISAGDAVLVRLRDDDTINIEPIRAARDSAQAVKAMPQRDAEEAAQW